MPPSTSAIWCSSNKYFASQPGQIQPKSRKKMGLCPKMGIAQRVVSLPGKVMIHYVNLVCSDKPCMVGGTCFNHQSQNQPKKHDSFPGTISWVYLKIGYPKKL